MRRAAIDQWLEAEPAEAFGLRSLPDDILRIVAKGERTDDVPPPGAHP